MKSDKSSLKKVMKRAAKAVRERGAAVARRLKAKAAPEEPTNPQPASVPGKAARKSAAAPAEEMTLKSAASSRASTTCWRSAG